MTPHPSLTDPPDAEPVTDWRDPEHQADLAREVRERGLAAAREALKAAGARGGKAK